LDSLCAPFLTLLNDEALAFSCYHAFIPKFMKDFFISDNTPVMQEYLAVFRHLLSFHDPELSRHLNKVGYHPELYATEFNDCIMVAELFPNVDIEKCVQSALSMYKVTPPSVLYRVYESDTKTGENQHDQRWWEQPTPIEVKKAELTSRISLKDLVKLKNYVLVIDTRTEQEFGRGHFPLSINMNPVHLEQLSQALWQEKKKYHVVVGIRGESGPSQCRFPRVAVLNGGIDVMRDDGVGVV
ncbi:12179_t:CDS:2, partial [Gigaspora rosea]